MLLGTNGGRSNNTMAERCHTYEIVFELIRQKKLDLSGC